MANTKLPWPANEEILAAASEYTSRSALARHFGIQPPTFNKRCEREPEFAAQVDAALQRTELEGVSDLDMAQHRIRELEAQLRARKKADVVVERVAAAVTAAIEARGVPKFTEVKAKPASSDPHEMILLWSDTHFGEVVSAEETNGMNEYDMDICWDRHRNLRDALFSYVQNRPYRISKLHVLALGDMLSGSIHEELRETNEVPLAETAVEFGERGAEWLNSLLAEFDHVEFCGVVGNHPRFTKKMPAKKSFDNADWISYHYMRGLLRNHPGISFDIPKAHSHLHTVLGRHVLLSHGDSIMSTMPGVPWGGVMRRVNQLHAQYVQQGVVVDLYCFGHFHQRALVNGPGGSRIALNGSIKGVDEYGLKRYGGGEGPGQLLLTYHEERGVTDVSYLDP